MRRESTAIVVPSVKDVGQATRPASNLHTVRRIAEVATLPKLGTSSGPAAISYYAVSIYDDVGFSRLQSDPLAFLFSQTSTRPVEQGDRSHS